MEKISIKTDYNNLTRAKQPGFREKVIQTFEINYNTFYSWLTRDNIPKKFHEKYLETFNAENINQI
jgi:hypothetical protein